MTVVAAGAFVEGDHTPPVGVMVVHPTPSGTLVETWTESGRASGDTVDSALALLHQAWNEIENGRGGRGQ